MDPTAVDPAPPPDRLAERLDRVGSALERRVGPWAAAGCAAGVLLVAAAIYVTPQLRPIIQGAHYQSLSNAPFSDPASPVRGRFVSPLLAWLLRLNGPRFVAFPPLMALLFLGAVIVSARRRGYLPAEAWGAAALVAFSSPVLSMLQLPGFVDITTCLLLFLAFANVRSPAAWSPLLLLAILNHESALFIVPGFLVLAWPAGSGRRPVAAFAAAVLSALVPALLYRLWLERSGGFHYSHRFYLQTQGIRTGLMTVIPHLWLGVFMAFKLFWILPILGARLALARGDRRRAAALAVVVAGALTQICLAGDVTRLVGLAFPAVLLGADEVRRAWGPESWRSKLWLFIGFHLLVPQYFIYFGFANPQFPLPLSLLAIALGVPASVVFGAG